MATSLSSFAIHYIIVLSCCVFTSNLCVWLFLFYNTIITFFFPCFTNVCSSRACSWVCPVFFSFTMSCCSCVNSSTPVPGSAKFSSPSPCPVTPVSPVSTFQLPVPGSAPFTKSSIWCDPLPIPGSGLLLLYHRLHFLSQLFQCLALIFRLRLLFFHQLYCLLSVHFLNEIPLFQSHVSIFLYLVKRVFHCLPTLQVRSVYI